VVDILQSHVHLTIPPPSDDIYIPLSISILYSGIHRPGMILSILLYPPLPYIKSYDLHLADILSIYVLLTVKEKAAS
jgi:hypothetical protein